MKALVSDNIRVIREAKNYSQEYVATKLNVTQQAYSSMEKNPENMSLKRLRELCKILDVELITLLGEENVMVQQNYNQQGGQAATNMVFQGLSENEKSLYERFIAELKHEISFLRTKLH
jgi:transcriptional regulator with XRE-family HTH domain